MQETEAKCLLFGLLCLQFREAFKGSLVNQIKSWRQLENDCWWNESCTSTFIYLLTIVCFSTFHSGICASEKIKVVYVFEDLLNIV